MADIREALALPAEAEDEHQLGVEEDGEAVEQGDANELTIACTSLVGAKGLSGGYVHIVGCNDGHFPRDPDVITDEVCCFLVGLSRTRKECHVISCNRFGNEPLNPSRLLDIAAVT